MYKRQSLHEDVLRCLLDVAPVVEQPRQHDGDATLVAPHELAEGFDVTGPRGLDELGVGDVHGSILGPESFRPTHASDLVMKLIEHIWQGSCHETAELMSRHLEDDLAGLRGGRVRRHLARCAACQAVLRSLARVVDELRSLRGDGVSPTTSVADAVVLRIRHDELGAR